MIPLDIWVPGTPGTRRLVLWRHGRTAWNAAGRAQGHANVSLDAVGRAEALRAAPLLASYSPSFVWSSDLARALETAAPLVDLLPSVDLVVDRRLREYDVGVRQGLTFAEFEAQHPAAYASFMGGVERDVPGAETTPQVVARMLPALTEAAATVGPGETGVVVGHGASLRTGLLAFLKVPAELGDIFAGLGNCAWAVLELRGSRGWQVIDYNAQTLPEPLTIADDPRG